VVQARALIRVLSRAGDAAGILRRAIDLVLTDALMLAGGPHSVPESIG